MRKDHVGRTAVVIDGNITAVLLIDITFLSFAAAMEIRDTAAFEAISHHTIRTVDPCRSIHETHPDSAGVKSLLLVLVKSHALP